jgi:endonuclease/exonuclease/phosphatase family metal-dependent hydrolase
VILSRTHPTFIIANKTPDGENCDMEQQLMRIVSREQPAQARDTVRVMTYNVHRCRGLDRRWSPERIAEVIADCRPDIVALQELDVGRARSGRVDQAEVIARALGMDVQFFPALRVMEELYGDAILTRWPARLVKTGGLPRMRRVPRLEPRGALWSSITVGGIDLQVINTHLGILARERLRQIETLLGPDWLGHPDCRDPVVLAGDFNAAPRTRVYRRLSARLADAQRAPCVRRARATFPTRFPTLRIDHVFVSRSIEVLAAATVRTPLARLASDHLPVVVDLRIAVPAAASQRGTSVHKGAPRTNRDHA